MERLVGEKKRNAVVVVGGGVAGSLIAKTLQDHADVYLIDPKEYYEISWTSLRSTVEPSFAERTLINHSEYVPNARVITGAATDISRHEVVTSQVRKVPYDYLVIATGHADDDETSLAHTIAERQAHYQSEQEKIKSAKSILIVGGGPTGVELAAEIAVDFPDKKVTLVHRGSRLLGFIGEKAGKKALDWLVSKKVEVILGQSVVNLNSPSSLGGGGRYETSGDETVIADCHFVCTGSPIGSSWIKKTILKDSLDSHGRLMVDAKLRVIGHSNIFAIGDIANIPVGVSSSNELKQGYLAQAHASVAAKNLKLLIKNGSQSEKKLSSYKPAASTIAFVSLGRREGVAQIMCLTTVGRIPGMIKSGDLFVGKTRKLLGLKSI
ncbi:hypothetical protein OROHE_019536 [Orobanche hederae]